MREHDLQLREVDGDVVEAVGFVNSGGLVFMDESAEEIPTL